MERKTNRLKHNISIAVLVILHGVGLLGFFIPEWQPLFRQLTPWHLIITAFVLLENHDPWNRKFGAYCLITFLAGWGIEVVGIQTGLLFGSYQYGSVLGWAPAGVPFMIGVNWLMLVYAAGMLFLEWRWPDWAKALMAGSILVLLDIAIEQFAVNHNLWQWQNNTIPFQNYLAWFVVGFLLLMGFYKTGFRHPNPIALPLLLIQFLFFYGGWIIGLW